MAIFSFHLPWKYAKSSPSASKMKPPQPPANFQEKLTTVAVSGKSDDRKGEYAKRRILKELKAAIEDPPSYCSSGPIGDDIFQWQGAIIGPDDTPFEAGIFLVSIEFSVDHPFRPPKIKFKTKVFHPNISEDGTIHVDILGPQWSPCFTINALLLSICSLLPHPNPQDPHNPICNLYRTDRKAYNKKASEWTVKYAMG